MEENVLFALLLITGLAANWTRLNANLLAEHLPQFLRVVASSQRLVQAYLILQITAVKRLIHGLHAKS